MRKSKSRSRWSQHETIMCLQCGDVFHKEETQADGPLRVLVAGKYEMANFCHPQCVLDALRSNRIIPHNILLEHFYRNSLKEIRTYEPHVLEVACNHCKATPATRIISSAPWSGLSRENSPMEEWDIPGLNIPGGIFCSVPCFVAELEAEVQYLKKWNLRKWYKQQELSGRMAPWAIN